MQINRERGARDAERADKVYGERPRHILADLTARISVPHKQHRANPNFAYSHHKPPLGGGFYNFVGRPQVPLYGS